MQGNKADLGKAIMETRKKLGYSIEEVCKSLDIPPKQYMDTELGNDKGSSRYYNDVLSKIKLM